MKILTLEQLQKVTLADYSDDDRTRLSMLRDLASSATARVRLTIDDLWTAVDAVHYALDEGLVADSLASTLADEACTAFLGRGVHKEDVA